MIALPNASKLWANPADLIRQWEFDPNKKIEEDVIRTCVNSVVHTGDELADLGCGVGRYAAALAPLGLNYTGFDASSQMIELAKAKEYPNANFACVDIFQFSSDVIYDICLLVDVLIHQENPISSILRIFQLWEAKYYIFTLLVADYHQDLYASTVVAAEEYAKFMAAHKAEKLYEAQIGEAFKWVVVLYEHN